MAPERARGRLHEIARRHGLSGPQEEQLASLLGVLERSGWAPTTVRSPERAVDVHVADSLAGLEIEQLRGARRIADVGAGAGFPGIALAIALPGGEVRLVESQGRKCRFMADALLQAGVANAEVVCARAEEWRAGEQAHDAVVARALAAQPVVLEYAAPLLRLGGALVDWRGRRNAKEEAAAQAAGEMLGLARVGVRRVEPYAGAGERHLHVFVKREETPSRFPRRPGMARKRPLGAAGRHREPPSDRERR